MYGSDSKNREIAEKKQAKRRFRCCCYANYKRIGEVNVKIALTLQARDYKGWNTGFQLNNGVIVIKNE